MTARTFLTARFDVTDLSQDERGALALEVSVQGEASDLHPSVDPPEIEWDEVESDGE